MNDWTAGRRTKDVKQKDPRKSDGSLMSECKENTSGFLGCLDILLKIQTRNQGFQAVEIRRWVYFLGLNLITPGRIVISGDTRLTSIRTHVTQTLAFMGQVGERKQKLRLAKMRITVVHLMFLRDRREKKRSNNITKHSLSENIQGLC